MTAQLERLKTALAATYDIERELGAGGMAVVYLGRDVKHDRQVAIKVLNPDLSATIGADRFQREIKVAAKLQHPHILGLYDSGEADGLLYYVMPFVEGESLRDRLDREGQLPLDDALQLILEVADALGHAHTQNIVHRDIKPENILLQGGHALVADFGIARAVEEGGAAKLTQTGMAVGTPVYMSPEQAVGEKVGPAADIYSLGCMLYEMLAGEPPFTGKNAVQIMARHAMEQVPSVRIVRQSVPEEMEEAIFAAMEKSPADRPKTCGEFTEILGMPLGATATRRAMNRTTTRRTPSGMTRSYQTVPMPAPVWRRPWVLALAGVLVVGGGLAAWQFSGERGGATAPALGGLDPTRVAVLYFDDTTPASELGYLADGLTEGLIETLGQVQGLSVISRTGVAPFRSAGVPPDSIARALGAGTLVEGAIAQAGDRLRISLNLFDGSSGARLESASFERASFDLIGVRDTLAVEAARLIQARIGQELRLREQRNSTGNSDAWLLVQRAEQQRKSGETASAAGDTLARRLAFSRADSMLAAAELLDARWVHPIVQRGLLAYRWSRLAGRDRALIQRWVTVGLGHVERALAIEPAHADGLELRGNLRYWSFLMGLEPDPARGDALLASAKADLEQATLANPNQAGAYASLSHLYNYSGSGVDVNIAARRALEADAFLDNASVILGRLFLSSYDLGNFPDATLRCDEIRRRFGTEFGAPRCALFMLTTRDREPDVARAWRLSDSVVAMAPANNRAYQQLHSQMLVAAVLGRAGRKDSAVAVIRRSLGNEELNPTRDLALFGAAAYAQMGETGPAVDLLKIYLTANPRARGGLANEPGWWFRPIAQDPRFRQLVGTN
ncbi:MAG: protein kinase [Gemmatimonadales bacterium]